jgi:hypothetical protein
MEEKKSKFEIIKKKAEESKYVPSGISTLRAGVAAIPFVGGALDHLIFDRADEIKVKNIEKSIDDINDKMNSISEENLTKEWFESAEALEMFKQLIDKVQFEADDEKIKTIADIYAVSGTNDFSSDPNKFAVLRKAAELSTIQKEILLIISNVPSQHKEFSSGGLQTKATAIWFDDILNAVKTNPKGQFWTGTLKLDVEIGILESLGLVRNSNVLLANVAGYELTGLGNLLIKYLKT